MYAPGEPPTDAGDHTAAKWRTGHGEADGDRAADALAVLNVVSRALTTWDCSENPSLRLLRDLAGVLELAAGVLWLPVRDTLVASTLWAGPGVDRVALERVLRPARRSPGASLAGRAWQSREPVARSTPAVSNGAAPSAEAGAAVLGSVALPLCWEGEVLAVIELYSVSNAEPAERPMRALGTAGQLLGTLFSRRRGELKRSPLTARELEVLGLAARGFGRRAIAQELGISPATVKTHFEHIFRKLAVPNRTAAVAQALRGGLIG